MRFIDQEELKPTIQYLIAGLEQASELVSKAQNERDRRELIIKHRPKWIALRDKFEAFSYGKCWYVECKTLGADNDIDHFRPKLSVKEEPTHPGYYWLAFDWRNLRLSCQRANRPRTNPDTDEVGGKAEHFPILPRGARAFLPGDDLDLELPALIDPTNLLDTLLLAFNAGGDVALSPKFKGDVAAEAKFDASRIHLHLNWPKFRDARVILYNDIDRTVGRGQREAPGDATGFTAASAAFKDAIRDLRRAMDPRSEYSTAARHFVESFRHIWWVRDIVLKLVP